MKDLLTIEGIQKPVRLFFLADQNKINMTHKQTVDSFVQYNW